MWNSSLSLLLVNCYWSYLQSLEAEVGQEVGSTHERDKVVEQEVVELLLDTLHAHTEVLQEAHDLGTILQADLSQQEGAAELNRLCQLHVHGRLPAQMERVEFNWTRVLN